jgi:sulfate adenylyltransferase
VPEETSEQPPIRLLFVCTANICRSAYAEVLARHLLGGDPTVEVASAGTHGWRDHAMDEEMATTLVARDIDPTGYRSRRLTMRMVEEADLVLTAEVAHRRFILDDRPGVFRRLFTLGQFDRTLDDVPDDLRGRDLVAAAGKGLWPAAVEDDVQDPYRRGPEAAAVAAQHIETLLTRFLPRLSQR